MLKQIYQNKYKKVIVDTKTGLKKEVVLDQNTREEIAKGVHLQPYGKDDKRFFDIFKQNKKLPDGTIINIQEHNRLKKEKTQGELADENEDWKQEQKERMDKFGSTKKWH